MNHIWSNGNPFKKLEDAFTPLNRFNGNFEKWIDERNSKKKGFIVSLGRDFRVGGVPWGIHLIGDEIPTSDPAWTTRNQYKNYWGYELLMLEDAAKYIDFTYRFPNISKPQILKTFENFFKKIKKYSKI